MTNKEAIDTIKLAKAEIEWNYPLDYQVALDMAIESLSQEPCEDAISRQAVLDEAFEVDTKEYGRIDVVRVDAIDALPPVTPQPKMGRWIDDKCSICGKGIEDLIDSCEWYENETPNYCPFCGVRVVESEG